MGADREQTVEIWYSFALDKPKPTHSIPQDEWVSTIKALTHIVNDKAKTYVAGFFNGDLKIFGKHNHAELLSVRQLHPDSMIEDALFLKNDALGKKLVITCSGSPNVELKVSEVSHVASGKGKQYQFNTIAQSREKHNGESFRCLSSNPMSNEYVCSGGVINTAEDGSHEAGVLIWKID